MTCKLTVTGYAPGSSIGLLRPDGTILVAFSHLMEPSIIFIIDYDGPVVLRVRKAGFLPWQESVTVSDGAQFQIGQEVDDAYRAEPARAGVNGDHNV